MHNIKKYYLWYSFFYGLKFNLVSHYIIKYIRIRKKKIKSQKKKKYITNYKWLIPMLLYNKKNKKCYRYIYFFSFTLNFQNTSVSHQY